MTQMEMIAASQVGSFNWTLAVKAAWYEAKNSFFFFYRGYFTFVHCPNLGIFTMQHTLWKY